MRRQFFLVLFLAIIVFGAKKLFFETSEEHFNANLIEIDTASVTSIILNTRGDKFESIQFQKEANQWLISKGNFTTKANPNKVRQLLNQVQLIQAKKMIVAESNKWAGYGVAKEQSNHLQFFSDGKKLEDFYVGIFDSNQPTGLETAYSYLRLADENEVYALDASVIKHLVRPFNAYRNQQLITLNPKELTSLVFDHQDSLQTFQLAKQANQWQSDSTALDSTTIAHFISTLSNLSGTAFADGFDELQAEELWLQRLAIHTQNQTAPILVNCYVDTMRAKPFIIHSNQNKDAFFESDSSGIYTHIFKNLNDF